MAIAIRLADDRYRLQHDLAVNAKDGSVLVRVPAGEFERGDDQGTDCPKHRVRLDEYWIGVYCVTNRRYGGVVEETKHRAPDGVWQAGRSPEAKLDHPVVNVSWDDAVAYGKWSGLSLPSEAQWEKAARGPQGLSYPWGSGWDESRCRNDKSKGSEQTASAWGYPAGASGTGTYQQGGNVYEWCADWYEEKYYAQSPTENPPGPQAGAYRVGRGGSWRNDDASNFRGAYRNRNDPSNRNDNQGFRLVSTVLQARTRNCPIHRFPCSAHAETKPRTPPPPVSGKPTVAEVSHLWTGRCAHVLDDECCAARGHDVAQSCGEREGWQRAGTGTRR